MWGCTCFEVFRCRCNKKRWIELDFCDVIKIQALSPETCSFFPLILASEASLGERAGEAQICPRGRAFLQRWLILAGCRGRCRLHQVTCRKRWSLPRDTSIPCTTAILNTSKDHGTKTQCHSRENIIPVEAEWLCRCVSWPPKGTCCIMPPFLAGFGRQVACDREQRHAGTDIWNNIPIPYFHVGWKHADHPNLEGCPKERTAIHARGLVMVTLRQQQSLQGHSNHQSETVQVSILHNGETR